ncbi:MAG: Hsp20/alpha crystallin family protein [Rubrivivax sp.]|nr:Hsp20/alpha crystallin family protein [Rubrivivax sp.]
MFLVPVSRESRDIARSVDRLFDEAFGGFFGAPATAGPRGETAARSPALDVAESDRAYTVKLEMPGVKKEDIKVTIEGKRISLSAHSESAQEKKEGDRVVYRERSVASYARSFTLPVDVDQAGAGARLENGVLTLELPKRGAGAAAQLTVN